jgi:hypothetical protein
MSVQRIVVADSGSTTAQITRATLDLIERPAVVVEARSGADALVELKRGEVNLLVSASTLIDMRGFELALKVIQTVRDVPVIILASIHDPDEDDSKVPVGAPVYHLARAADGDRFVRILRAVLDGEEPSELATPTAHAAAGPDLGPIPSLDVGQMTDILSGMLPDVGAMAILLLDRGGTVLKELGAVGYLDRERLASTLTPVFANMANIGPLVGGNHPQAIHYFDGDEFDIFMLAVGLHHYVCLVFEGAAGSRAFGAVTMYGRRAVQDMLDLIGDAAYAIKAPAAKDAPPQRKRPAESRRARPESPAAVTQPTRIGVTRPLTPPQEQEAAPPPKREPETPAGPILEPLPDDVDLESMLAGLGELDLSKADALFDPDKLAEIAADVSGDERLSFEEAQQMGMLKD